MLMHMGLARNRGRALGTRCACLPNLTRRGLRTRAIISIRAGVCADVRASRFVCLLPPRYDYVDADAGCLT